MNKIINFKKTGLKPIVSIAFLSFQMLVSFSWAQPFFSGGNGTNDDPYKISTPADLVELSTYVNLDTSLYRFPYPATIAHTKNTYGKYFVMTNDIDMATVSDFVPIGKGSFNPSGFHHCFCGNFDGGGFSIKNLTITITGSSSDRYIALFGDVIEANISNLTLNNALLFFTGTSVLIEMATFAVQLYNSNIDNCIAMNCTLQTNSVVCGFAGSVKRGRISNCQVINAEIESTANSYSVCGFSGSVSGESQIINSSVTYSSFTAPIICGFIGTMDDVSPKLNKNGLLSGCYVSNCILSAKRRVCGFASQVVVGEINNCYVQASLSRTQIASSNPDRCVGFIGNLGNVVNDTMPLIISNCYAACEITNIDGDYSRDASFGGERSNQTNNDTYINCYYLTHPQIAGFSSNPPTSGGVLGKSQSELKSANIVDYPGTKDNSLNFQQDSMPWKSDFYNPINRGCPILSWQEQQSSVTTSDATDITKTSAILHGSVFDNEETVIEQGFQWRVAGTNTWSTDTVAVGTATISTSLTGLYVATLYEFRAYIKTAFPKYGETLTFTTLGVPSTVITMEATDISQTSVTLHGMVEENEEVIVERGFQWRLEGVNTWSTVSALGTTNISVTLTSLYPKRLHEFRAYVKTASFKYGEILTFIAEDGTNVTNYLSKSDIALFPNPAINQLRIESGDKKIDKLEMIIITGKVVKIYHFNSPINTVLDISELQNGMYFVIFYSEGQKITKKMVKF